MDQRNDFDYAANVPAANVPPGAPDNAADYLGQTVIFVDDIHNKGPERFVALIVGADYVEADESRWMLAHPGKGHDEYISMRDKLMGDMAISQPASTDPPRLHCALYVLVTNSQPYTRFNVPYSPVIEDQALAIYSWHEKCDMPSLPTSEPLPSLPLDAEGKPNPTAVKRPGRA